MGFEDEQQQNWAVDAGPGSRSPMPSLQPRTRACQSKSWDAADPGLLLEMSADWIWRTDARHAFVYLSDGFEAATGMKPQKVLDRTWFDSLPTATRSNKGYLAHLDHLEARRPFRDFVYEMANGPAHCRWLSVSGYPLFDKEGVFAGYEGIARNITHIFAAQNTPDETHRQLKQSQDLLRAVFEALDVGIVVYDRNDRLLLWNSRMAELYPHFGKIAAPGMALRDLLVSAYDCGQSVDAPGATNAAQRAEQSRWVEERLEEYWAPHTEHEQMLDDGRWVQLSNHRLGDGMFIGLRTDITATKERERKIAAASRQAEELLFDLTRTIEAMDMGVVVVDADMRAEIINPAFHEQWKTTPEELPIGSHFRALMDFNRHNGIYDLPDERWEAYVASRIGEIRAGDVAPREFKRADGRTLIYSVTALSGGKRLISYFDVTEMKEREETLRESSRENELFRSIIDNVPVAIYAKQTDLKLVYVNKGWCDLTGLPLEDAIGKTDADIFGPDGETFMRDDRAVLHSRKPQTFEETVTRADGSIRYQEARKSVMAASDGSLYLIGSTTDISEMKERERELRDAQQKAELADRAKSEFLANMSHEIRTPMNGVLGMAELLAKSDLDSKQKTFTDIIVKSGNALLTIINDILDFSKIDAGQLVLDPAPFNLVEAIEDVATLVSTRAKEKDLELIVRVDPELPEMFVGDVGRIRQIVTNLMGNAVKFTDTGHVLVDVNGKIEDGYGKLRINVTDTGIGIPKDKIDLVFDKFSQVDASSTRRHEGTGLGLAITSKLVAMMGGEIGVESEFGKGSTFWLTLDLPISETSARRESTPIDVTGARILIIDDNAVNRAILSEQMASWSFDACAAASGEEGLQVLHAAARHGIRVDCVILDYQMPGMTGADVSRVIRSTGGIADTPIIMLTSVDQSLSNVQHRHLGINAQLIKPARSSHLLETIVTAVQKYRAPHRPAVATNAPYGTTSSRSSAAKGETAPAQLPQPARERAVARRMVSDEFDILVAEDHEVNQLVFTQILTEANLRFKIVGNGELALQAFREAQPRIILMDVSMPKMSGLEAAAAIRKLEEESGTHVPIIGVTAHALKGDRERCIEAGMDDYLSKPISPNALLEKVARWSGANSANLASAGQSRTA